MKQAVVTRNVAYALNNAGSPAAITSINAINTLDTGSLAIFTEGGVLVTAANMGTVLDDVRKCYFAVGNQQSAATAKSMITVPFPRIGSVTYNKQTYTAPVKLRKFIGSDGTVGSLNMPTYYNGSVATLKITDTTPGLRTVTTEYLPEQFRYQYTGIPGDTNNTMITKLIAAINLDPDRIVDLTVVGSQVGIQIDARNFGTTFAISLDDALVGATVEQPEGSVVGASVAINYGIGTYDAVQSLEDNYSVERGNTNRTYFPIQYYSNPALSLSGSTYNLYTIEWDDYRSMPNGFQPTNRFEIVVAIPTGTALATSFETIMAEVFAGTISTSPVETGA